LCGFAKGKSTLTGIRSLRVKETERVKAIQNELGKMGIMTESPNADTLIIHGGNPKVATIETYNDHRMAMSFAVAKAAIPEIEILAPEVVRKTFPNFWDEFKKI
jgi:3-phosphoshikimate 1-carboxyvinyltransferase